MIVAFAYRNIAKYLTLSLIIFTCQVCALADVIGYFFALDADLHGLEYVAHDMGQPIKVGTHLIQRLQLDSHTIYAVKMGSGAAETASSAQALLSHYRCDWGFSLGPAATMSALNTGQWYRVGRVMAWQRNNLDSWNTDWSRLPVANLPPPLNSTGTITVASGEQFISSTGERDHVQALTLADALDMNGFGLSLVCADHGVPLFSWKIISDRADENAGEDFRAFTTSYKGEGGRALAEIIRNLPANPNDPASYPAIRKLLQDKPPELP